ncbi:hypothetical protein MSG28_015732 [Choristoneura fumiferana]|uniref:Uncharacterized protein n=1 Tax=Choristoneura fumiferana TaxID=7141 RepID=A0ACC0KBE6_CHOFU|nr:hypothetical protein MSG28_015732 [Choristoneura fumiferana]
MTNHDQKVLDYWNAIWTENVDPSNQLRTNEKPVSGSVKAKVMPGSKLYDLVLALQKMSPRLLYIINDNKKNK